VDYRADSPPGSPLRPAGRRLAGRETALSQSTPIHPRECTRPRLSLSVLPLVDPRHHDDGLAGWPQASNEPWTQLGPTSLPLVAAHFPGRGWASMDSQRHRKGGVTCRISSPSRARSLSLSVSATPSRGWRREYGVEGSGPLLHEDLSYAPQHGAKPCRAVTITDMRHRRKSGGTKTHHQRAPLPPVDRKSSWAFRTLPRHTRESSVVSFLLACLSSRMSPSAKERWAARANTALSKAAAAALRSFFFAA
jgi:hypothetical protein